MPALSVRNQTLIGIILLTLITITRGQHFATLHNLASATWAAFFIAGIYLRPRWVLLGLVAFVWSIDLLPHLMSGASMANIMSGKRSFCLTPAYFILLPAYGSLWLAGRWYAGQYSFALRKLLPLFAAMFVGAVACELFSSGGFYLFSGRFPDPTFAEFAMRLTKYFPGSMQSLAFYVGIAAVIHILFVLVQNSNRRETVV